MLDRGCRNFIFLSRSGTAKPEAAEVIRQLRDAGVSAEVFCVDASDEKAVAKVVADVSSKTPIKGVVHAAMVLQVSTLRRLTQSRALTTEAFTKDEIHRMVSTKI